MLCSATLASGESCERNAEPGSKTCSLHRKTEQRHQAGNFYRKQLKPEERRALADAIEVEGLDDEIAVLRVLIRRVLTADDVEVARRGIATLLDLMRATHKLDKPTDDPIGEWLDQVLDELDQEEESGTEL